MARVAVVDGDERHTDDGAARRAKNGMPDFPPHSTIEIASRSWLWPSARKTNGSDELFRHPFHEHGRPSQEQLAALGVELGAETDILVRRCSRRLDRAGPGLLCALDEGQLVKPRDVEERRRMRGVDDLVPAASELPQQPVEVALGLRAQVQLGLLDQQHHAANSSGATSLERGDK